MEKMSPSDWERKWKLMVGRDINKRIQNKILNEKLKEKKELEEATECTFCPKIQTKLRPGETVKRSRDEVLQLLLPIISEEESILKELNKLEEDEKGNREELAKIISYRIANSPGQDVEKLMSFYRDERLRDVSSLKNSKVEIVGKLLELERKFNFLCSSECIDPKDLTRAGFEIDNSRRIREEILSSIDNYDTLKTRSRISAEFEEILKTARTMEITNTQVRSYHDPRLSHGNFNGGRSIYHGVNPYGQVYLRDHNMVPYNKYHHLNNHLHGLPQVPVLGQGAHWQVPNRNQTNLLTPYVNRW